MNKKDEYFPGDFIAFDRKWGSRNCDKVGIIVNKILRSELDRKVFWFKHDYEYLVSLKQYKGDYGGINTDYYFQMKEHHSHINGMIKDENLNKMWEDYLVSGMEFRVKLMGLNNMVVLKD